MDKVQAYAAGFIEGHTTRDLIAMHWANTEEGYCSYPLSAFCQKLQDYLDKNFAWIEDQIAAADTIDPYWHHVSIVSLDYDYIVHLGFYSQVNLFLHQIAGLIDGFHNDEIGVPHRLKPNVTNLL